MRPGIELRSDYDAARLRSLAKATRNAGQSRRLLALAEIYYQPALILMHWPSPGGRWT